MALNINIPVKFNIKSITGFKNVLELFYNQNTMKKWNGLDVILDFYSLINTTKEFIDTTNNTRTIINIFNSFFSYQLSIASKDKRHNDEVDGKLNDLYKYIIDKLDKRVLYISIRSQEYLFRNGNITREAYQYFITNFFKIMIDKKMFPSYDDMNKLYNCDFKDNDDLIYNVFEYMIKFDSDRLPMVIKYLINLLQVSNVMRYNIDYQHNSINSLGVILALFLAKYENKAFNIISKDDIINLIPYMIEVDYNNIMLLKNRSTINFSNIAFSPVLYRRKKPVMTKEEIDTDNLEVILDEYRSKIIKRIGNIKKSDDKMHFISGELFDDIRQEADNLKYANRSVKYITVANIYIASIYYILNHADILFNSEDINKYFLINRNAKFNYSNVVEYLDEAYILLSKNDNISMLSKNSVAKNY